MLCALNIHFDILNILHLEVRGGGWLHQASRKICKDAKMKFSSLVTDRKHTLAEMFQLKFCFMPLCRQSLCLFMRGNEFIKVPMLVKNPAAGRQGNLFWKTLMRKFLTEEGTKPVLG